MSLATRQYENLLDDIKHQLPRIKTEMGAEIQQHSNHVLVEVTESANPFEDAEY